MGGPPFSATSGAVPAVGLSSGRARDSQVDSGIASVGSTGGPLPCLALRSYVLDGTRTKLPTPVHILAHPASLPELSRKVTFVSRSSHRNIQKMSLEKGVTCFIWFMYIDGKNEENILFLKMIQIRTNNTRSQSIADPRESAGAAISPLTAALGGN